VTWNLPFRFRRSGMSPSPGEKVEFCLQVDGPGHYGRIGADREAEQVVNLSTMAIVCCFACRSHPTIFISASFVPSLLVGYLKVYSARREADLVMSSVTEKSARLANLNVRPLMLRHAPAWNRRVPLDAERCAARSALPTSSPG
jgi:hypothetical protein